MQGKIPRKKIRAKRKAKKKNSCKKEGPIVTDILEWRALQRG